MIFKVTWGEDLRTWVTSQGSCFQAPGRKKDILGPHRALPFGYQTIEIVDPKKLEFPQESRAGGRERLIPTSQKRNLPPPHRDFTQLCQGVKPSCRRPWR